MAVAVAWVGVVGAAVPLLLLAGLLFAARRRRPGPALPDRVAPPLAVLMPAHDEAAGIGATIAALLPHLRAQDRLLVVADNCTDDTARIAREAGAEAIERDDAGRIGKGFALAFGRAHLAADPRAVVIVVDADCHVAPGALARLGIAAARYRAAVQGCYLLTAPAGASAAVRTSCFAFLVKNRLRQRALARLGAPALLQGSGMAFPWPMFAAAPLASGSLVEDLELGLRLVAAGERVRFEEEAHIFSAAASQSGTRSQRRRWEHGITATAATWLPRLIAAAARGRPRLLPLAGDLAVPPLSMVAVAAIAGVTATLPAAAGGDIAPLAAIRAALLLASSALGTRWWQEGRDVLPPAMLARLPVYLAWKLPVVAGLLRGRERTWRRTERTA